MGVHGHVLKYGLESVAAGSGDEHDEFEHSETDVNHSRSLHSGGSKTMPFYLYVICTVSVTQTPMKIILGVQWISMPNKWVALKLGFVLNWMATARGRYIGLEFNSLYIALGK